MFSHSCNGTSIFIRWKMKCTIHLGFASLNGRFHPSPHENICTIAHINIHYLYIIWMIQYKLYLQAMQVTLNKKSVSVALCLNFHEAFGILSPWKTSPVLLVCTMMNINEYTRVWGRQKKKKKKGVVREGWRMHTKQQQTNAYYSEIRGVSTRAWVILKKRGTYVWVEIPFRCSI